MLEDKIAEIEMRLQNAPEIKPEARAELLNLVAVLKAELAALPAEEREHPPDLASSTGRFPSAARHRVDEFEEAHPQLVAVVNRITAMLSNMGI